MDTSSNTKRNGVIYVGAIDKWFDFSSLYEAARQMPEVPFNIVGALNVGPPSGIPSNLNFLGELPHREAVLKMMNARIGVLPFITSKLTDAIDPVKVYEYLAAGLGVVSSFPLQSPLTEAPLISISDSHSRFAVLVAEMYSSLTAQDRAKAISWAGENSWARRAERLVGVIGELKKSRAPAN